MALSSVRLDSLKALKVNAQFTAQIPLDYILTLLDRIDDLGKLLLIKVLCSNRPINIGPRQNVNGVRGAKAINVSKRNIDPLLSRNVYTQNTWHTCTCLSALTLLVARI